MTKDQGLRTAHTIPSMSDAITDAPMPPPPETPLPLPPRRSRLPTLLAWVVILALVTFIVVMRHVAEESRSEDAEDRVGLLLMRTQARYLVGAHELLALPTTYEQARALNTGTVAQ